MKLWNALPGPMPVKLLALLLLVGLVWWIAHNPAHAGATLGDFFTKGLPAVADWLGRFLDGLTGN